MAGTTNYGAVQLNIKFGDSLLNVCADDVETLVERVGKLADNKMILIAAADEFRAASIVANTFQGTTEVGPPPQQPPPAWQNAAPAPAPVPYGGGRMCAHNLPYVQKSGTNAQGKAWSGQFCQFPDKNAQCAPIWSGR